VSAHTVDIGKHCVGRHNIIEPVRHDRLLDLLCTAI